MPERMRGRVEFAAAPGAPRAARDWLLARCREADWDATAARDLALALSEAAANVVRHAYADRVPGPLMVELDGDRVSARLRVSDRGCGFDEAEVAGRPRPRLREGGFGLSLMRAMTDGVDVLSGPGGTCVTMIKRSGAAESAREVEMDRNVTSRSPEVVHGLEELCRVYDIGLDMIQRSDDVDGLLDRILDEYERRLQGLGEARLESGGSADAPGEVRGLVMFAAQAAALKEKAAAAARLRQANDALRVALADEERGRRRLDEVLAALDAGVVVADAAGSVRHANRAAARVTGLPEEVLVGARVADLAGDTPTGGDGSVVHDRSGTARTVLVSRRALPSEPGAEVVLLSDLTAHERELERRHQLERLAEMMRTLGALSHKINNPLTSLMGRAQLLQRYEGTDERVRKAAAVIEESSRRIADYIRELAHTVKDGRQDLLERLLAVEDAVGVSESGARDEEVTR